MTGIAIKGTGRYLPDRVVANDEFSAFIETSDEWIRSHTGIQRRRVAVDEPTWYMGAQAARQAMDAAGVAPERIDIIIGTTVTADYRYPSMACMVQNAIGAVNAFAYDVAAACAGSTMALDMARRYLATGGVETILVVCAEALTQATDFSDRATCVLFGDGAGAFVITRGDGVFGSFLHSDATGAPHIFAKHPRLETPFSKGAARKDYDPFPATKSNYTVMNGHEVYRFATRAMPRAIHGACDKAGIPADQLDLVIPHQANLRIIEAAAKYMKLPMEKVYVNIQEYGNTSSATVAICFDECVRSGRLKPGDKVCAVGFGAGLVYGAVVFEYRN